MPYQVEIKKNAQKSLDKIPAKIRKNIDEKIAGLADDPRDGAEKMPGFDSRYKIRQGGYRILFEIDDGLVKVIVIKVEPRGGVYKGAGR